MTNTIRFRWLRALFGSVLLFIASPALAQEGGKAEADKDGFQPVKRLVFTPDDVEGRNLTPQGERIDSILGAQYPSLIELRQGFEAEIVKSMEDM